MFKTKHRGCCGVPIQIRHVHIESDAMQQHSRELIQQSPLELVIESLCLGTDKAPQQSNVRVAQQK